MSSLKEVSVSCWAIFGSLTKVPAPWRRSSSRPDEVVEGGADGQAGDPEVAAQAPLRRDGLAHLQLVDQLEHALPGQDLFAHRAP
jgi:hypothetical protein